MFSKKTDLWNMQVQVLSFDFGTVSHSGWPWTPRPASASQGWNSRLVPLQGPEAIQDLMVTNHSGGMPLVAPLAFFLPAPLPLWYEGVNLNPACQAIVLLLSDNSHPELWFCLVCFLSLLKFCFWKRNLYVSHKLLTRLSELTCKELPEKWLIHLNNKPCLPSSH